MSDELEVCWNGAHNGRDDDLLRAELRVPEKRTARSGPRPPTCREVVLSALERAGKASQDQIAAMTGLPRGTVNWEFSKLRRDGLITCAEGPTTPPFCDRPYRLVREGEARALERAPGQS